MKAGTRILIICLLVMSSGALALSAQQRQQQIVTRVDTANVTLKHGSLSIRAVGMGRTPSGMGRAGRLIPRGGNRALNKDGLLEYDLVFNGVANYSGFKLKPVSAKLKEHSVPQGVKGVRIFGEFNEVASLLAQPTQKKSLLRFGKKPKGERSEETTESITGASPHP